MNLSEEKNLVGACGIDCDACNKHSKEIMEGAIKLKAGLDEKIGVAGAAKIRSRILELKNYKGFYEVLEWFATQEGVMNNGDCVKCRNVEDEKFAKLGIVQRKKVLTFAVNVMIIPAICCIRE